jgi:hypothetical protein
MKASEELVNHIRELEEKLLTPEVRSSKSELQNLLADDFFEIGSSGRLLYKDEEISEDGIGIVKMKLSDFELHPLADELVLATYRIFNELNNQHSLRSSIWKQHEGIWKMVFHQGTKTNTSV